MDDHQVLHDGKCYAPRVLLALAEADVNGTKPKMRPYEDAVPYLRQLGFEVAPTRDPLRRFLEELASQEDCDLALAAKSLVDHKWGEVAERVKCYGNLREILREGPPDAEGFVQCIKEHGKSLLGGFSGTHAQVNEFLNSPELPDALQIILTDDRSPPNEAAINEFVDEAVRLGFHNKQGQPHRSTAGLLTSMILTSVFPHDFIEYRPKHWKWIAKHFGLPRKKKGADYGAGIIRAGQDARMLTQSPTFQDYFPGEYPNWTLAGVMWLVASKNEKYRAMIDDTSEPPADPPAAPSDSSLTELANRLLLDVGYLAEIKDLLHDKGQAIFYGPPGTGKTYVARELASHIAGSDGAVEVVQFHPSYAYEDFVEGYRPVQQNGQPGFSLVEGPLKRIARRAQENPGATHFLLIDEINRGNIAKVFGELYYLLEYRDQKISLQYNHEEQFALPRNLWIIGTMNTADRSIALIDAALRRRFYFLPFFPDESPVEGLLRRWLERHNSQLLWVADVVDRANEELGDRHSAIGPSYFLRTDLNEDWVRRIWRRAILPYIEEQFIGEEKQLERFDLDLLRRSKSDPAKSDLEGGDAPSDTP